MPIVYVSWEDMRIMPNDTVPLRGLSTTLCQDGTLWFGEPDAADKAAVLHAEPLDPAIPWWQQNHWRHKVRKVSSSVSVCVRDRDAARLFWRCDRLSDIGGLSAWNLSEATSLYGIFEDCFGLSDFGPLSAWDVSSVRDLQLGFCGCRSLMDLDPLSNWDVSSVVTMRRLFKGCCSLRQVSALSGWDVSNVKGMRELFAQCYMLSDISGISAWDTSSVYSMRDIFRDCVLLGWNKPGLLQVLYEDGELCLRDRSPETSGRVVRKAWGKSCSWERVPARLRPQVKSVTSTVDSRLTNAWELFRDCKNLVNIEGLARCDVSSERFFYSTFRGCSSLSDLSPLISWDISSATITMEGMFEGCPALRDASVLDAWRVPKNVDTENMFDNGALLPRWFVFKYLDSCTQDDGICPGRLDSSHPYVIKQPLDDLSWTELGRIAEEMGRLDEGEDPWTPFERRGITGEPFVKNLYLRNGAVFPVRVIDFYQDDRSDGHGQATMTWLFDNVVAYPQSAVSGLDWSLDDTWTSHWLRMFLNYSLYDLFPKDLQDVIKPVDKLTSTMSGALSSPRICWRNPSEDRDPLEFDFEEGFNEARRALRFECGYDESEDISDSVTYTCDRVWALSRSEVFGWIGSFDSNYNEYDGFDPVNNVQGTQYRVFAFNGVEENGPTLQEHMRALFKKRIGCLKRDGSDSSEPERLRIQIEEVDGKEGPAILRRTSVEDKPLAWWLRSFSRDMRDGFGLLCISKEGLFENKSYHDDDVGVLPGFCI